MSLPGKLCVGILEEDNPLRSYFRFKPLLVDNGGAYAPYDGASSYPEEASIRIVPDKNESYHFKARMRQIGLFCVVDLRAHPGESDKIRPNKNYRPGGEEINASIIYSDVVRAPAEDMIYEILPSEALNKPFPEPRTREVLLRGEDALQPAMYGWEAIPDSEGMVRLNLEGRACDIDGLQIFDLPGFRSQAVSFAIRPATAMAAVSDMPERPAPRAEAPTAPAAEPAPKPEAPVERVSEPAPRPQPAPEPAPQSGPDPEPAPDADKPWIHHDDSMLPPPVSPHLSRAEQLMAAQAGLNPRRGRSLQELIDEKWQHSRLNQLGQPVTPISTGVPVKNPIDTAVAALRSAWSQPDLRHPLMDALSQVDEFTETLRARHATDKQAAIENELNNLEAQRLELLSELDRLKAGDASLRQKLKQEIRMEEDSALAEASQRTADARLEQRKFEQLAQEARMAANDARAVLDQLAGDQLEQKIRDVALTRRVLERLELLKGQSGGEAVPEPAEAIDLNAFVDRVQRHFDAAGWAISRLEAANLCACLTVSPVLLLTGAPGSGKSAAARLLAEALGLNPAVCAPDARPADADPGMARLRACEDRPAVIVLEDANLAPAQDLLRGLGANLPAEWRVLVTLQDAHSGLPVRAAAWDQGFAVRLAPPDALAWQPAWPVPCAGEAPASISAIAADLPRTALPSAMESRMKALRDGLARQGISLSRRGLNDAWRYCAAMLAILDSDVDADAILDHAIAQRLLPTLLASAPVEALAGLRALTEGMPLCRALLDAPLPIVI